MPAVSKYIDEIFHFPGQWDMPSICGLKIVSDEAQTVVIVTNLYEENPGTSISRWVAPLAMMICEKYHISYDQLVFIEHNPDRKSNLDFYKETFDMVAFNIEDHKLSKPVWKRIEKKEADALLF